MQLLDARETVTFKVLYTPTSWEQCLLWEVNLSEALVSSRGFLWEVLLHGCMGGVLSLHCIGWAASQLHLSGSGS